MTEKQLHKQICIYIKAQYPNVIFNTDMSGIKLTMGQAIQAKLLRSDNGFTDIQIFEPREKLHGLFIELKKETPYKKNGELKKSEHLLEQIKMHDKLKERGYCVHLCWTFEMTKKAIDEYLSLKII